MKVIATDMAMNIKLQIRLWEIELSTNTEDGAIVGAAVGEMVTGATLIGCSSSLHFVLISVGHNSVVG